MKRISLAVCLALMPFAADAAGLGKLTVFSGLGEPLNAEIELSASKEELSSLAAKIAPADTYSEQGLQRPVVLGNIKLEIAQQSNGKPVIKLSSPQPIEDPFLDMLIQVEWSNGRLLREYTALLDPPGYGEKAEAATPTQVTAPSAQAPAGTTAAQQKAGKSRKGASAKPAPEAAEGEYITHSGDTLRSVAKQLQVEGVSLEQMLVGLYRTNPDAFMGGNMNRLKTGQILRAPSSEELQAVSQQEAAKEIRIQTADWNAYRQKLAGAVAESAVEGEAAGGQSASGKITAAAEDKAAVAPTGPRDVVKLSKSDTSARAAGPETPATKEDAIAREKAAREADARVASLEKQVQDMQKLLELKNRDLAALQNAPAETKQQPAAAPVPAPTATVTPPPAAEVKPPEVAPVPAQPPVAAETKPAEPPLPKKPRRAPPVVEPEPTPAPDLLEDPVLVGGVGGGLIAALLGGWLYLRNKRRRGLDSFEQGILTTSGLKPNTVFGNTAGGMVDTGDTSLLTDLSQGTGGMIDTNDVDPIAEAEVYMAYGRDVQAEEILKDAVAKDPKRYELHNKLLEIYSNRKDTTAFETLAGELYATLGPADATWQKFAAMGRALEPNNPLYQGDGAQVSAVAESAVEPVAATVFASSEETGAQVVDTSTEFASTELPGQETAGIGDQTPAEDLGLDFDLGDAEKDVSPAAETAPVTEAATAEQAVDVQEAEAGLDFSFELPEPAAEENIQLDAAEIGLETAPEVTAEPVVEDISFELPELNTAASETATETAATEAQDFGLELPELELPDAGLEEVGVPETGENAAEATMTSEAPDFNVDLSEAGQGLEEAVGLELPSLELEDEATASAPQELELPALEAAAPADEIILESVEKSEPDLDFNFEMDIETPEAAPAVEAVESPALPDLNLSGISLDLEEPAADVEPAPAALATIETEAAEGSAVVEEITLAGNESADVDTKLDLVAAYMDMGDTEGARELLEEVLREGGPQQRERAQGLLDSLA